MKHRILCLLGWHEFLWFNDTFETRVTEPTFYGSHVETVKMPCQKGICIGAGCKETRIRFEQNK